VGGAHGIGLCWWWHSRDTPMAEIGA